MSHFVRFLAISIILGSSISLKSQDFSLLEKRVYEGTAGKLPYRILFPENYDSREKYPLVLFLHGGGERGDDNEKQLVHGVKHFIDPPVRSAFPCILIAPQCPEDSYWSSVKFERTKYPLDLDFNYEYEITKGLQLAIDLTKEIIKEESVDKSRVYITGLSMGGMGTFEAIYRFPRLFAAAAVVCGGADAVAYGKRQAKIPFWIFHGDADQVISVEHSRKMVTRLKALNAEVKYTEYSGVNHNSWENAYAEPMLLPWLFSKKR
ncbi:MAG: prolyl oligopeptidase family serine peptidase [Saprospiraceae bacterium]|nr:prolyl oligopeptidase family serine peptidase [Saprospiraceae bacterium]